ncbi:MAG TPA: RNA polymerase sigma factor SigM [Micromonosporaceae bacterium]|nr:RNA polymerase sigma factor SigM [Micromonosporaceae bacterium]
MDDAALLRAHVAGNGEAFGELVRRHRDRMWAVAIRTLGDREDAADAVQDALVSAYRSAHRFRGESAVTTWLHRIVVNACLDRARRRQSRPTVPLPDTDAGLVGAADPPVDSDTALVVHAALSRLPAEQRVALVLLDMQGYSVAEIAEMLGVPEGTVKSRCARARARLAVLLGHLRLDDPRHTDHPLDEGNQQVGGDVGTTRGAVAGAEPGPPRSGPPHVGGEVGGQGGVA